MADRPRDHQVNVRLPADQEAGLPADFAAIWHTRDMFILDFAAFTSAEVSASDDPNTVQQDAVVVSRVRIPPAQVFEMMKALEQQLSRWEQESGAGAPSEGAGG